MGPGFVSREWEGHVANDRHADLASMGPGFVRREWGADRDGIINPVVLQWGPAS